MSGVKERGVAHGGAPAVERAAQAPEDALHRP